MSNHMPTYMAHLECPTSSTNQYYKVGPSKIGTWTEGASLTKSLSLDMPARIRNEPPRTLNTTNGMMVAPTVWYSINSMLQSNNRRVGGIRKVDRLYRSLSQKMKTTAKTQKNGLDFGKNCKKRIKGGFEHERDFLEMRDLLLGHSHRYICALI